MHKRWESGGSLCQQLLGSQGGRTEERSLSHSGGAGGVKGGEFLGWERLKRDRVDRNDTVKRLQVGSAHLPLRGAPQEGKRKEQTGWVSEFDS